MLHTKGSLEVDVLKSDREFAALEEEWEELLQQAPLATPFQSWAWLYSWWEYFGKDYELELVVVRDRGGLLVGILPFMLDRRWRFARLLFIGTGLTDYLDILVREGWEAQVAKAGLEVLQQSRRWRVADLQQLRPEAGTWSILGAWLGPQTRIWQAGCPVIETKAWDELLTSLSKKRRKMVRRTIRQAEAEGIHCKQADVSDAERAARRLVALHRELWWERDIALAHLARSFESLVATAAPRMMSRGLAGISEFWHGEEVIISNFWVSGQTFLGVYILGVSREALQRYQWSSLCIWDAVNIARSKNSSHVDLLRGEEPYKLRWTSKIVPTHRLVLGRHRIAWLPYAGYHTLYSGARRYANSESTPQWVKNAADTYRALQRRITRHLNNGRKP